MTAQVWRVLTFAVAIVGAAVGVSDVKVYRGHRTRRLLVALVIYTGLGLWTVTAFGDMPWSLLLGVTVDAVLLYAGFQAVTIWNERLLHLESDDEPIKQCPHRRGLYECAGMLGHLGPHVYTGVES